MNHFWSIKSLLFPTFSLITFLSDVKFFLSSKMNRLFGQSKSSAVPKSKPTLNDTATILDSRVETLNKQIAIIDQGLFRKKKNFI